MRLAPRCKSTVLSPTHLFTIFQGEKFKSRTHTNEGDRMAELFRTQLSLPALEQVEERKVRGERIDTGGLFGNVRRSGFFL